MKRATSTHFDFATYTRKAGLDPEVARAPVGVLMLATTLAAERCNGKRLSDLSPRDQKDLIIDAADQLAHYQERHS